MRPLTHSLDYTEEGLGMEPTRGCSIEGCNGGGRIRRGWCRKHYNAWWRYGDPLADFSRKRPTCTIDGCSDPHMALGYCWKHYARVRTHGDPERVDAPAPMLGIEHPRWVADMNKYDSAHARVRRRRGPASALSCAHCGGPAKDWAYDHLDPAEQIDNRGGKALPFSLDLSHYMPLCRTCHRRFDLAQARTV